MSRRTAVIIGSAVVLFMILSVILFIRNRDQQQESFQKEISGPNIMDSLQFSSSAFEQNGTIPKKYTCQGEGVNPPLTIIGVPEGTKSLAVIVDDPDAPGGVWDHWILWNIAPDTTSIAENSVPVGAMLGSNSSGQSRYEGPCPPVGTHRYRFSVYAVSDILALKPGSSKTELLNALTGKILGQYTLIGLYQKS